MAKDFNTKFTNFYNYVDDPPRYHNPHANVIGFTHPGLFLECSPTGGGKTTTLLNIIEKMNCFDKLIVFAKNTDEPLYKFLKKNFHGEILLTDNIEDLPDLSEIPANNPTQSAIIFDDIVTLGPKIQQKIASWAIACRKKNYSFFYLTQMFRDTPKIIRRNCNYVILLKLHDRLDITNILRDYSFAGIEPKTLIDMYNSVQEYNARHPDDFQFFWIDCNKNLFCSGFKKVFKLSNT